MRQPNYGKDTGLTLRIMFTMFMLGIVWVVFMGLLFWAGIPWFFIMGFAVVGVLFQYFSSEKIVLMTTGAREVSPEEEPWLHSTVERLAQMADMPKPGKIAIMETHVPNAFATGRSPNHAIVAVSRGLLSRLDQREIEAVLGHELTHVKNRDVAVMTWASLIVIAAGYLLQMMFWMSLFGGFGGRDRREGGGNMMMIMLAVYVGTWAIYLIAQVLIMALSRYREFAADRGGAMLTGAPMQLASALSKISNDMYRIPEQDLRNVEHANAFMFVPALKGNNVAKLLSSHPTTEKRIEKLQEMQREMDRGFPYRA
ncbi:MAG: zinc metalloprotease HtpX [SAR202 cluster bacterium]|nr:zinc metalloprotease HtpX [SAR202 cluster bacterium]MDP6514082.1 zinc metalloprotease HtpX [SAR202 cluster bacterium]MDP6714305.1 zinc metalloprotease HtpX [SAR202 cluster bacterium]